MTRYFYTLLLFVSILLIFNSCERVLAEDIYGDDNKLVIISNFTPDHQLEVEVTSTRPITSSNGVNEVTNAIVTVYEDGELIEELILSLPEEGSEELAKYVSINFLPQVGVLYTVKAIAPGYSPAHATNIIPKGTMVGDIGFNNTLDIKNDAETADVNFSINLNFQDDPEEDNFYHILFSQQLLGYRIDVNPDGSFDTISVSTMEYADINFNLTDNTIPHVKFIGEQSMLLKDEKFDGEEVNLAIEGNFSFNIEKYLPGTFSVEIRTVSQEYYYYYTTVVNQSQANDDELVQAEPVFDNVQDGIGIFAGYSTDTTTFLINP